MTKPIFFKCCTARENLGVERNCIRSLTSLYRLTKPVKRGLLAPIQMGFQR